MNRHTLLSLTSNDQDWIRTRTAGRMSRYLFSISLFIAHNLSLLAGWRRLTMTMSMLRVDLSTIWAARSLAECGSCPWFCAARLSAPSL